MSCHRKASTYREIDTGEHLLMEDAVSHACKLRPSRGLQIPLCILEKACDSSGLWKSAASEKGPHLRCRLSGQAEL